MNTTLSSETVPESFAEIVSQYGNRVAISAPAGQWTYDELDRYSDWIALEILARLGESSEPVALIMQHDAPLIGAIFGSLKANKIYAALDPGLPLEQLSAMLAASGTKLLLIDETHLSLANSLNPTGVKVFSIPKKFSDEAVGKSLPEIADTAAAWLMFTSGTTGKPKGVWQNHRGLVQEGRIYADLANVTPGDRMALLASCSLSASGATLFAALLSGATLCLFHLRSRGIERLAEWLQSERITIFHSVPTVLRHLAGTKSGNSFFPDIRLVRLGGEPVLRSDVEFFRKHFSDKCIFIQSFSSTETGIVCMFFIGKETELTSPRIPVGRAIDGVQIFLLDEQNQPLENGGEGRIAVRSTRLKRGYWGQPELTKEKFKSEGTGSDSRLFLSNDIGRYLPDGSLEHLGRADLLVKIRGQRVDLGEVEAALMATGLMREAVVLAQDDKSGEKRLVAFFVRNAAADVSPQNIRRQLLAHLLEYMIPVEFIAWEKLPQTPAGKIDRSALQALSRQEAKKVLSREHTPRDAMETRLLRIWESTLKISPISRKDDFFELGGTSLQSVEVLLQIEELFGVLLPPSTLAEHSTIEKLSAFLGARTAIPAGVLVKLREGGDGQPLFLIHSGQGDLTSYGLLTRRLTGRPIYGLQSVGIGGESWPLTDLRAMALRYLPEILKYDPTGPYLLAGTCMGGLIAFELARMLSQQGKAVSFLGLIDTMFPLPKTRGKSWLRKGYISLSTPLRECWQMARWKTIRGLGLGQGEGRLRVYRRFIVRMNARALRFYEPKFYSGKMTLFVTTDTQFEHEDPRLVMKPLAQTTDVIKISGIRTTLFVKPAVDELAKKLQSAIESSE